MPVAVHTPCRGYVDPQVSQTVSILAKTFSLAGSWPDVKLKCRAVITVAPVPSLGVDNMLDSLAGAILDADGLEERQRRKEAWKAMGGKVQSLQRLPGAHALPIPGPNGMEWRFNITLPHSPLAGAPAVATGGHSRAAGGALPKKTGHPAQISLATSLQ